MSGHRFLSPNARVASAGLQFPDMFPVTWERGHVSWKDPNSWEMLRLRAVRTTAHTKIK